jgi:CRP/FNR family transcriptional regulator
MLAPLSPEDRRSLAPLCQLHAYEKGETIFQEGDSADLIHFVFVGRVKILKAGPERDLIIDILGPGDPLGTVAVFERRPYPATAVAIEPSGIVSIPEREFFALIEKRPEITRRLFAGLTMRLMSLNRRLADMTGSVEYRAARLFTTLAERLGKPRGKEIFIPMALSRQEIADLLGTTLETAIRVMSRWQKEGFVETEKTGFLVHNAAALSAIAPEE